jgi:RND superfamily putative drug exporter
MLSNAEPNRHNLIVGLEFGIVAAAIVLLMVYGSAIAVVPVLMALPAILVTFLSALGLTYLTPVMYSGQVIAARCIVAIRSGQDVVKYPFF